VFVETAQRLIEAMDLLATGEAGNASGIVDGGAAPLPCRWKPLPTWLISISCSKREPPTTRSRGHAM